jgi:hypothetical protein
MTTDIINPQFSPSIPVTENSLYSGSPLLVGVQSYTPNVLPSAQNPDIIYTNSISSFYDLKDFNDVVEYLNYKKNEKLNYLEGF